METWTDLDTKKKFDLDALGLEGVRIAMTERDSNGTLTAITLQDAEGNRVKIRAGWETLRISVRKDDATANVVAA